MKQQKNMRNGPLSKPCEVPENDDYNCLNCPHFNECQMTAIGELKAEMKLEDDY